MTHPAQQSGGGTEQRNQNRVAGERKRNSLQSGQNRRQGSFLLPDLLNKPSRQSARLIVLACLLAALAPAAHAYVGPGAGFALASSFLTLFIAMLAALLALVTWPARWVLLAWRRRRSAAKARVKRVVVLGIDGMEPRIVERFMAEGKLPNFSRLQAQGAYSRLRTTAPAMTPVAWSTYLTGCNPGKHRIFDFLTRDPRNYKPLLSSVAISPARNVLRFGKFRLPLGGQKARLLRKGKPFWQVLGRHGIFSNVIRMPITFPPEKLYGACLSAMSIPDLRGTQGTYSLYSSGDTDDAEESGEHFNVEVRDQIVRAQLLGPENPFVEDGGPLVCDFSVRIHDEHSATLELGRERVLLKVGCYSDWMHVSFRAMLGVRVRGICRFLLIRTAPEFSLYVTPVQIDPASPAMQISHPKVYATYLSKLLGTYATIGLAEDTWGLNANVLDDRAFVEQCDEVDEERVRMFLNAVDKVRHGYLVCVVDGPDRINHMFWRYEDPRHPAHDGQGGRMVRDAIESSYRRMDEVVGEALERIDDDPDTVFMVLSDHGCVSFRHGVDLNYWLEQNGYLTLLDGGRGKNYLEGVDWSRTRAYGIGLTGIWLNIKGREAHGIVDKSEAEDLRAELIEKLTGLRDEKNDEIAIRRVMSARETYTGPYVDDAPDLIVGYNEGYRVSWEGATGLITDALFHDNHKAWSGDHIIDPELVPGVFFCNRKISETTPHIADLAPTTLDLFGIQPPSYMDGQLLTIAEPAASPAGST